MFDLQSWHESNGLSLSNITKGDNARRKKGRSVILVRNTSPGPVLHFYQVPSKYSKGIQVTQWTWNLFQIKQRVITPKVRQPKFSILYATCCPDIHFYQVSSKYSKGYSSYRTDKTFYTDTNLIRPKNNVPCPSPTFGVCVGGGGEGGERT